MQPRTLAVDALIPGSELSEPPGSDTAALESDRGGALAEQDEPTRQNHALVTGAAQGIGAAVAVALADAGHTVTALDIKDAADTVRAIEACGGSASGTSVDVRD